MQFGLEINALDFEMSKASSIGIYNNKQNVYMRLTWD